MSWNAQRIRRSGCPSFPDLRFQPPLEFPKQDLAEGLRHPGDERKHDRAQCDTRIEIGEPVAHDEHTLSGPSGSVLMRRFREEDRDVKNGAVVVMNPISMPVPAAVEPTGDPSLVVLIFHVLKCENCH